ESVAMTCSLASITTRSYAATDRYGLPTGRRRREGFVADGSTPIHADPRPIHGGSTGNDERQRALDLQKRRQGGVADPRIHERPYSSPLGHYFFVPAYTH